MQQAPMQQAPMQQAPGYAQPGQMQPNAQPMNYAMAPVPAAQPISQTDVSGQDAAPVVRSNKKASTAQALRRRARQSASYMAMMFLLGAGVFLVGVVVLFFIAMNS